MNDGGKGQMSWSDIVAKGNQMKVPTSSYRKDNTTYDRHSTESIVIYEREELAAQMKIHRAEVILQQSLHPDTVLFEFPASNEVGDEPTIYKMIEKQLGLAIGFRCVSHPNKNKRGNIIIEAKLTEEAHEKALTEGVTFQGVKYLGTPTNTKEEDYPEMVKIHLSNVPLALPEDLKDSLLESLAIYGKVCQIRMVKHWGYFTGDITILMDRNQTTRTFEPLQRMMYLSTWQRYYPASFKGAPPVCYHCRQSNHLKKDCPILAAILCYSCHGKVHIARNCHSNIRAHESDSDDETLEPKKRKTKEPMEQGKVGKQQVVTLTGKEKEKSEPKLVELEEEDKTITSGQGERLILKEAEKEDNDTDMTTPLEQDTDFVMGNTKNSKSSLDPNQSLQASKHAPVNDSLTMNVDTAREMLNLSTSKTPKRRSITGSRISQIPVYSDEQLDKVILTKATRSPSKSGKSTSKSGSPSEIYQ